MSDFSVYAPVIMRDFMHDLSLLDFQAAGIVGNFGHESDLVPGVHEIGASRVTGGIGFGQWSGSRHGDFVRWCVHNGLSTSSEKANYGFALAELRSTYAHVVTHLRACHTLADAVRVFEREYEMAGVVAMGDRLHYAELALDLYRKSLAA